MIAVLRYDGMPYYAEIIELYIIEAALFDTDSLLRLATRCFFFFTDDISHTFIIRQSR